MTILFHRLPQKDTHLLTHPQLHYLQILDAPHLNLLTAASLPPSANIAWKDYPTMRRAIHASILS
jgi:hypothetical protein